MGGGLKPVGGGLKPVGDCEWLFPMLVMVRVTEINFGSVKKNTNRPPSPTAVCVCGCVLCNFKFFGGNL